MYINNGFDSIFFNAVDRDKKKTERLLYGCMHDGKRTLILSNCTHLENISKKIYS